MSTTLLEKISQIKSKDSPGDMQLDQLVRWLCLYRAVAHIDKKANELGINFEQCLTIKPKVIRDFIRETFHSTRANIILSSKIQID